MRGIDHKDGLELAVGFALLDRPGIFARERGMTLVFDHPAEFAQDRIARLELAVADGTDRLGIIALLPLDGGEFRHRQSGMAFEHFEHVAMPVDRAVLEGVALKDDAGVEFLGHLTELF